MKNTALITGASSGIGMELSRIHASKGGDLVLVARSKDKLTQLKQEIELQYGVQVHVIEKDLSLLDAAQSIYEETTQMGIQIDYLINNAGFGDFGLFVHSNFIKNTQMIQLNITALTQLTHLYLKDMLTRKKGKIMNVASTAAFQPGPLMAVYFASKSYVLHFSEALHEEVYKFGINVTAFCPGATESGFQAVAAMEESNLVKGKKLPSSAEVAQYGYSAMMKGKVVAIHGLLNYLLANSVRFAPRSWVVKLTRKIQGIAE